MYLKSLELQGFKSFPDKTILEFERGITGVVGPNGSGKSNISDAIRWVLGEQSSKSLRGSKMEDVIFSGTRSRSSLSFAKVSLTLDNTDRSLAMDCDEVVVTRRYYRSGESEYLINQQNVRLRDVHELLMDTGLGRDGYAIVGQGKIAEIISAKSSDRRQIFEEAAGISKFRYRKEDAQKRLALAEDNLVRLRDILSELESRVGPLKTQSEKAHRFLELADQKKNVEIVIWDETLTKSKMAVVELERMLFSVSSQIESINKKIADKEALIEDFFAKRQQSAVHIDEMSREKEELTSQMAEIRSKIAVLENNILHAKNSIEKMEEAGDLSEQVRMEIASSLEEKVREYNEACLLVEKEDMVAKQMQQALSETRIEEHGVTEEMDALSIKISEKSKAASDAKVQAYSGRSTIEEIEATVREAGDRAERLQEETDSRQETAEKLRLQLDTVDERVLSLENSMDGVRMMAQIKLDKVQQIASDMSALENDVRNKEEKLRLLRDMENSMEGFSYSVKTLINESKVGHIRGIRGVVSKLIEVDAEYAVAIETALGAAMQHMVVDSEDVAKQCIAFLKKNKSGRATFLPLTSVKSKSPIMEFSAKMDGYIGVASELVSTDRIYKGIINNLLSRTLVVENIDVAVRVARTYDYRCRVVTLDGQMVNAGGSLTGGSLIQNAGVIGRSVKITGLKEEISAAKNKLESMVGEYRSKKEDADTVSAQLAGMEAELQTAVEEQTKYRILLDSAQGAWEQAKESCRQTKEEKDRAQKRLAALISQVEEYEKLHDALQQEVEQMSQSLHTVAESSRKIIADISAKNELLSNQKIRVLEIQKQAEILANEEQLIRERLMDSEKQKENASVQKEEFLQNIESTYDEINRLQTDETEKEQRVFALDQLLISEAENRDMAESQTNQVRNSVKDEMEDRERLSGEMARLQERKASAETEYDAIISDLWEEYEMTRSEAASLAKEIGKIPNAKQELATVKNAIKNLGSVNVGAIEEYKEVSQRYTFMKQQTDDVEKSKAELLKMVGELTGEMRSVFLDHFKAINLNFSRVFSELFGGGTAKLTLSDPEDVLESGIEIFVEPPGKIIKNLASLSGGEQAFVAISIYFAILAVRPAPFCVLDEIEAALDDVNVYKYAMYLHKMNDNTQFIAITHRRGTMEETDVLYGVTMQDDGVSKLLKLNVDEVEEKLGVKQ